MLYLVATPIGNLGDFSPRAVEILKASDLILCEDTRHSLPFLRSFDIPTKTLSYHKFSESTRLQEIISLLKAGKTVSLITDAGTPGLADPGQRLVAACRREGFVITGVPGPCAAILALTLSGFSTDLFQFIGFAPRKRGERTAWIQRLLFYEGTSVWYESPERILSLLQFLHEWIPKRNLAIARELTKKFEEVLVGRPEELLSHFSEKPPRGEFVFVLEGNLDAAQQKWLHLTAEQHVEWLEKDFSLDRKEAVRLAAEMRGVSKRNLYHLRNNK